MKSLGYIGKLMLVIPMAFFGFGHLANAGLMAAYVPEFFPFPEIWVYLTGAALVLAAFAIVLGKQAKLAAQLLALMLVIFAVLVHLPSGLNGDSLELTNFFKNIALAGGALFMSTHLSN